MEITRRSFVAASAVAAGAAASGSVALADQAAAPEPGTPLADGTYEAVEAGRNGDVRVAMTVEGGRIADLKVVDHQESDDLSYVALTVVPQAIVAGQTVNVDTVSGATLSSGAVIRAASACVEQAGGDPDAMPAFDPAAVEQHMVPGTYTGEGFGKWKAGNTMAVAFGGFEVTNPTRVTVEVDETSILSVTVEETSDTPGFTEVPCAVTPKRIVEEQSLFADTVSGCTMTAAAINEAVAHALEQAGANLAGFAKATPHPADPATEEYDADLVIVGAGGTGTSCALRAVELGLNTVVIEKTARISGQSACAYGAFAVGSKLDAEVGCNVTVDEVVRNMLDYAYWKLDATLVRNVVSNSGRMVDWLQGYWEQCGQPGFSAPRFTEGKSIAHDFGNGTAKFQALWDNYIADGVTLITSCKANKIVVEDGKVTGVEAKRQDGTPVHVRAKAVLVCTGGFGGNKAMQDELIAGSDYYLVGLSTNDGGGITMLREVGGVVSPEVSPQLAEFCSNDHLDYYAGDMKFINQVGFLMVDGSGARYMDESYCITDTMTKGATGMWRAGSSYVVLTQADLDEMAATGIHTLLGDDYIEANDLRPVLRVDSFAAIKDEMDAALAAGQAWKVDELDELCEAVGFDRATWEQTIATYRQAVETGVDELYGKDPLMLRPLAEGPFYCVRIVPPIFGTYNGIRVNSRFQMLGKDGKVAYDNLFVGGGDNAGVYSFPYTEYNGTTMCNSLTGGMLIAEYAAQVAQA